MLRGASGARIAWRGSIGVAIACLVAGLLLGCHAHHGSESEDLDPSLREVDLSEAQYRALCESFARRMGWPDAALYECLDGGAVGRIDTPESCSRRRHEPARIPDCEIRVRDWLQCADHYLENGRCDLAETCRRPPECMDGGWQYLRP